MFFLRLLVRLFFQLSSVCRLCHVVALIVSFLLFLLRVYYTYVKAGNGERLFMTPVLPLLICPSIFLTKGICLEEKEFSKESRSASLQVELSVQLQQQLVARHEQPIPLTDILVDANVDERRRVISITIICPYRVLIPP